MENISQLKGAWKSPQAIIARFILLLAVALFAELWVWHYYFIVIRPATPLLLLFLLMFLTVVVFLGGAFCGRADFITLEDRVMMRLLDRYQRGGILRPEDKKSADFWQSLGFMRIGFTDEMPDKEPVETTSFAPDGLRYFRQRKFEIQRGIWPSIKRSVIISVNS